MKDAAFYLDDSDISLRIKIFGAVTTDTVIRCNGTIIDIKGVIKTYQQDFTLTTVTSDFDFILPLFKSKLLSAQLSFLSGNIFPGSVTGTLQIQSGTTFNGVIATTLCSGVILENKPLYYPGKPSDFNTIYYSATNTATLPSVAGTSNYQYIVPTNSSENIIGFLLDFTFTDLSLLSFFTIELINTSTNTIFRSILLVTGNVYNYVINNSGSGLISGSVYYLSLPNPIVVSDGTIVRISFKNTLAPFTTATCTVIKNVQQL